MMLLLRRDGCLKFFQKPLDAKAVLKNRSKGIDIASALTSSSNNQVSSWIIPLPPLIVQAPESLSPIPLPVYACFTAEGKLPSACCDSDRWPLLQVEAMETEMAEELQREAEARNAVDEEDSEGAKPLQTSSPSLVLDEAAGKMGDGEKQRYGKSFGSALCTAEHLLH